MKKLSIFLMAFIAFIGISACSTEDDVVFVAQPDAEGIFFVNSFNANYVLTPATAGNVAERFVWEYVDLEVPTNISYELQGSPTEDFAGFEPLGKTGENNLAVSVQQLLDLAKDAGLDADPETEAPNSGQLYFRVRAFAGSGTGNTLEHFSDISSITVILPEATGEEEVLLPHFYLVGDVVAAGWNPDNNNTPLFRDPANETLFSFTGRFAGSGDTEGFKLLETLGAWQPQWGLDNGNLSNSDILGGDPAAFPVTADGYYSFSLNTDEMTYSFEPYDASEAATYGSIGIVGDATPGGWDVDTEMIQSEFDAHLWYAKAVELNSGEMKFRADAAWDMNWGANTSISGQATKDGSNIAVTAGTYDIWFSDLTGHFILIPQVIAE